MDLFRVCFEAHTSSATIYVAGSLSEHAASRTHDVIAAFPLDLRTVRVDLRDVEVIDPTAFVTMSRLLNRWRDSGGGRVTIEYPRRSIRATTLPPMRLVAELRV